MSRKKISVEQALEWKRIYEENPEVTIESLALDRGVGRATMQIWLKRVNTNMRLPRESLKGHSPNKRNQAVDGIKGKSDKTGIKKIAYKKAYTGHRRRGKGV